MEFWTALALICIVPSVCGILASSYEKRLKSRQINQEGLEKLEELNRELKKLDQRMTNLETIVLEHEKNRQFDEAL